VTGDVQAAKRAMRAIVLAARSERGAVDLNRAGAAIAGHGDAQWAGLRSVAAYLPVGGEPPTVPLLDALVGGGTRILLPVIDGDRLDWAAYTGPADVATGPLGISEPTGPRLGRRALAEVDLVLVPALAVDGHGNRLGRGRGYYDRALADVAVPTVAVVYDDELLANVPTEPHDQRVDGVLRPAGYLTT
jgi:5-formyltetrahydrofolate cyclo-ligase